VFPRFLQAIRRRRYSLAKQSCTGKTEVVIKFLWQLLGISGLKKDGETTENRKSDRLTL
jgi:hypothetical protein